VHEVKNGISVGLRNPFETLVVGRIIARIFRIPFRELLLRTPPHDNQYVNEDSKQSGADLDETDVPGNTLHIHTLAIPSETISQRHKLTCTLQL
jgi:hypothetical protein